MSKISNAKIATSLEVITLLIMAVILYLIIMDTPTIEQVTPLQEVQEVRKCYSPFDIYLTDSYEIFDDNKTLITGHGRVYNIDDCRLVK